jgi:hypothetical protein
MNTFYACTLVLLFALTFLLKQRWQRLFVLAFLGLLSAIFLLQVISNEMTKGFWAHARIRITEPTRNVLREARDDINAGRPERAAALLTHMLDNWDKVSLAPWMKSVEEVHSTFRTNEVRRTIIREKNEVLTREY